MDYKIEFERLLEYAKQGLSGVDIEKREVTGFLGLSILSDVVHEYENIPDEDLENYCSYSSNKQHVFDELFSGGYSKFCSYCHSRKR
jgi:hypothetical protein